MSNISLGVTLLCVISANYILLISNAASFPGSGKCAPGQFRCDNGRCISRSWKCDRENDCGDYSDERNCERCTPYQFQCDNGNCIMPGSRCDGGNNCGDWSDEIHCDGLEDTTITISTTETTPGIEEVTEEFETNETMSSLNDTLGNCASDLFRCDNGKCIYSSWKCDRDNDCGDHSDERNCGICSFGEFQCDSRRCIPNALRCDGNIDCGDYSDERNCGNYSLISEHCTTYQFHCDNGNCTRLEYKCDGDDDCGDWSDETRCDGVENATTTITYTESETNISLASIEESGDEQTTPGIEEVTEAFSTTETMPSLEDTLGLEPAIQNPQGKYPSAFYNVLQYLNFSTSFNRKQLRSLKSENAILHYNNTNLQVEVKELESEIQNVRSENLDITARLSALESTLQHNVTTLVKEQEDSNIASLFHTAQTLNLQTAFRKLAVNNMLTFPRARLYSGRNFTGESETYDYGKAKYGGGCHDLVDLKGKVKSVETFEKCVRVFSSNGCAGWSSVIYPGSGNSYDTLNSKLTEIGSVGPCLPNEFVGAIGSGHPSDKHRVPDLLEFFSIEKYQRRTGTFKLGRHNRVEFVRVTITRKVLSVSVSEANVEANEFYQSLDKEEDDVVGYMYPVGLGGPVDKNWNIFPQSPSGRDAWLRATSEIRPYLERAESKQVSLTTNVLYWNDESTRPYAFAYYINYENKRFSYGFIPN